MSETKSDVLLEVKNLHKAFDKHVVLNDVNTTVRKGNKANKPARREKEQSVCAVL